MCARPRTRRRGQSAPRSRGQRAEEKNTRSPGVGRGFRNTLTTHSATSQLSSRQLYLSWLPFRET